MRRYIKNSKQFFTTVTKHLEIVKRLGYRLVFNRLLDRCFDTVVKKVLYTVYYMKKRPDDIIGNEESQYYYLHMKTLIACRCDYKMWNMSEDKLEWFTLR